MRSKVLDLLNAYAGSWKTIGSMCDGTKVKGKDVYEWVDGQFFMVHSVDVKMGSTQVKSIEIIHYDELEDVFRSQSFDNEGNISISAKKIDGSHINIETDNQRFNGEFNQNEIVGVWEQYQEGCWKKWMDIKLIKI
jgi:hypothetical protein